MLTQTIVAAGLPPAGGIEGSVTGLLIYISVALGFSFFCSVLEAVLLSSSLSYVEMLGQQGSRAGRIMRHYKDNVEQAIAAILTLNTVAHTVGAAGAGAQAAALFGSQWIGVISAILTLLILVFSEIIPKTLGAAYWKQLVLFAAYSIQGLVWIFYPLVWAFQRLGRLIAPRGSEPTVTRSELLVLAQISTGEGALREQENRILTNLLRLGYVRVEDILTPRTVLFDLQQDLTVAEAAAAHRILPYSRIPIFDESPDDITAFVLRQDILVSVAKDEDQVTLKEISRPIHSVPESMTVANVLDEFMARQEQIFLVFDEYGGTSGIITLEDATESLLGVEITDESDLVADLQELARQRYSRQQRRLGLAMDDESSAGESIGP